MSPLEPAQLGNDHGEFPAVGARARALKRFERDLRAWLATPDGQFATWAAQQRIAGEAPAPPS